MLRDFREGDLGAVGERVSRTEHEAQAMLVDMMHLQIRRLDGQRDDADVNRAVLDALQYLVTEVAVDADVHQRIAALKFRKNIREQIEAGGFIGAEDDRSLNNAAAVRNDLNGVGAQAKQLSRVPEKNFAGRQELAGSCGAAEEPRAVCLFELT